MNFLFTVVIVLQTLVVALASMKLLLIATSSVLLTSLTVLRAEEATTQTLPFASQVISRLSLDGKPRSLSIRHGSDMWLGYDLERAAVFKAWQAPSGKPGLIKSGFATRSTGTTRFEDKTDATWELLRGEKSVPLLVRYLGCSQRKEYIELRWELQHDAGTLKLYERVPLIEAVVGERFLRELRVETLAAGESLLLPLATRKAWKLTTDQTSAASSLTSSEWYRLTLP